MLVMPIREADWSSKWDSLIATGKARLGSAAQIARAAGIHYHHLAAVKQGGSRKIGARTLMRVCKAMDLSQDETDDLIYTWLALKTQRHGEGRALIRSVEELQRTIARVADQPEDAEAAQRKVRSLVVRHFLEELTDEDD